jgi:translation initiation factor 3 subunit C
VKSQKDRTSDAIHDSVSKLRGSMRNDDWSMIHDEFEKLNKQVEKLRVDAPSFYIKLLLDLEELVGSTLKDKEGVKKLKPAAARFLNQMKLKVRKHNDLYRERIDDCKHNPQKYIEEVCFFTSEVIFECLQ